MLVMMGMGQFNLHVDKKKEVKLRKKQQEISVGFVSAFTKKKKKEVVSGCVFVW